MIQRLQERIKKKKEQEKLVQLLTTQYQSGEDKMVFKPKL